LRTPLEVPIFRHQSLSAKCNYTTDGMDGSIPSVTSSLDGKMSLVDMDG
jgi:hypothetical protein